MYLPAWPGLGLKELAGMTGGHLLPFPLEAQHTTYFHTARSAIYYLFKELVKSGRGVVLVPDYHMGNEVRAIRASGAQIAWYPATRRFEIDLDGLRRTCQRARAQVLFVIHYAGWPQQIEALRTLCDEYEMVLVEDCAMALLTERGGRPVGTWGDYAIFCLYKTLPLPDGAVLVQNRGRFDQLTALPLRRSGRIFTAGRIAELGLERIRSRWPNMGRHLMDWKLAAGRLLTRLRVERVPVGDTGFDVANVDIGMAPVSRRLLTRLDYDDIKKRRHEHFHRLAEEFTAEAVRTDLEPGVCPLFFPLLVADKERAAQALWSRGVMATPLWNEGDVSLGSHEGEASRFLRRHVLELPIHQDLSQEHLVYMARQVRDLGIALGSESIREPEFQPV
ncbi:MAG: dTDP-4-amino-4,6-dideoxygalactose transaminase [Nitrospira sp.]|jgi:dTDP-4-amino-4,6-dideoxygalactose transaminase|nr:dTDP-4-amino-4,6-dideoxygalactose transaminase [Nitrospira sp.]